MADNANRIEENVRRKLDGLRKDGLEAMQKGDFAGAEILRQDAGDDADSE